MSHQVNEFQSQDWNPSSLMVIPNSPAYCLQLGLDEGCLVSAMVFFVVGLLVDVSSSVISMVFSRDFGLSGAKMCGLSCRLSFAYFSSFTFPIKSRCLSGLGSRVLPNTKRALCSNPRTTSPNHPSVTTPKSPQYHHPQITPVPPPQFTPVPSPNHSSTTIPKSPQYHPCKITPVLYPRSPQYYHPKITPVPPPPNLYF